MSNEMLQAVPSIVFALGAYAVVAAGVALTGSMQWLKISTIVAIPVTLLFALSQGCIPVFFGLSVIYGGSAFLAAVQEKDQQTQIRLMAFALVMLIFAAVSMIIMSIPHV